MKVYNLLKYYFDNKIIVHFTVFGQGFKNGTIVDLSKETKTLVIKEKKDGIISLLLEKINSNSICAYKNPKEINK